MIRRAIVTLALVASMLVTAAPADAQRGRLCAQSIARVEPTVAVAIVQRLEGTGRCRAVAVIECGTRTYARLIVSRSAYRVRATYRCDAGIRSVAIYPWGDR